MLKKFTIMSNKTGVVITLFCVITAGRLTILFAAVCEQLKNNNNLYGNFDTTNIASIVLDLDDYDQLEPLIINQQEEGED